MLPDLSRDEILRYSRHLLIPEVGLEGQKKLLSSSVLIIGTGGLGSPVALYLAAAGIGRIGLVDFDVVDSSNLQRQIIHGTGTVGTLKVELARARLRDLNPDIQVDIYNEPFTSENAMRIAHDYDLLIDGTDNFPTRYLVNDLAVLTGKPDVFGSIYRFDGQASVFYAKEGPCYRCLFPEPYMGYCIGGCFAGKLLQRAPDRVAAAVFCQSVGHLPDDPTVMYRHGKENWVPDFMKRRPEVSMDTIETYLHNLYAVQPDFLYGVSRDFIGNSRDANAGAAG